MRESERERERKRDSSKSLETLIGGWSVGVLILYTDQPHIKFIWWL